MRTIQLVDGISFDIRGLKRKELRELKQKGFDLDGLDPKKAEAAMDEVFSLILTPDRIEQIENMENKYAMAVWRACLKETYSAPDEEKNS